MLLLMGQDWRNSLNRFAEAMTVCAVICAGMEPIIHLGRPWFLYWMFPYPATMGVWPQFRSPLEWDVWAVLTYLIVSILFWYIGLVPDLATVRDRARKRGWQVFFGIFALGWRGSARHWAVWNKTYRTIAAIAVPLVVSVHSEVSLLFASGQIPGWHSTIFPPYFVLGAAFSGFAMVAMIAIVMRHTFKLGHIVTARHLDVLAKVTLAMGMMTAYGYFFEVFDAYYSGELREIATVHDRFFGTYAWAYWGAVFCNFVPLQGLWLDRVRRSPVLLFLISTSVVDRHVARALHDPRHQPLQGLPAVLVRLLSRELLGLEHLHRDARPVHDALPAVRPLPAVDLDLRGQGSARARKGGRACLSKPSAISANSGLLEALLDAAKTSEGRRLPLHRRVQSLPGRRDGRGARAEARPPHRLDHDRAAGCSASPPCSPSSCS